MLWKLLFDMNEKARFLCINIRMEIKKRQRNIEEDWTLDKKKK